MNKKHLYTQEPRRQQLPTSRAGGLPPHTKVQAISQQMHSVTSAAVAEETRDRLSSIGGSGSQ